MKRFALALAAFVALAIAGYVWVDTQWPGGWGTPGWVEDARKEILATPLFNDPPPNWIVKARTVGTDLGGDEHITAYWTAPGTVADAIKALHDRHGDQYTIRPRSTNNDQRAYESWTRNGSQLMATVSYATSTTPNRVGVKAEIDVDRDLLRSR